MRSVVLILLAGLVTSLQPAQATEVWPAVPPEIGVPPVIGPVWSEFRCSSGAYNFYHDAYYGEEPPALYRGYAYRPFYRYTAYRRLPRTYYCVTE